MAGKVSQAAIEAVIRKNPNVRVSTLALEVVRTTASATLRGQISQVVIEVAKRYLRVGGVSQLVAEVAAVGTPTARVDQLVLEVAYLVIPVTSGTRRRPIGGFVG